MTKNQDNIKVAKVLFSQKNVNEEEEIEESISHTSNENDSKPKSKSQILHVLEVREHIRLLWQENSKIVDLVFGHLVCNQETLLNAKKGYSLIKFSPENFFIEV